MIEKDSHLFQSGSHFYNSDFLYVYFTYFPDKNSIRKGTVMSLWINYSVYVLKSANSMLFGISIFAHSIHALQLISIAPFWESIS